MKFYSFLITIYFFSIFNVNAQKTTLFYDLKVSGKTIGNVKTTKNKEGDKTIYISNTKAKISFIFKINIDIKMAVVFKNDRLISSDYRFYKNDNLKEYATISCKEGKYILDHDHKITEFKEVIKQSTIVLPFEVPKNNTNYFEEVEGYFKTIKTENNTLFKLMNPVNNRKDDYLYKEGIMQHCIVRNSIVDFKMELKKEYGLIKILF